MTNMHAFEGLSSYIDPPRRLGAAFGAVRPDLAAAGETIFCRICPRCHKYSHDQRTSSGLIRRHGMRHRRCCRAPDLLPGVRGASLTKPARLALLEFSKRTDEKPRQENAVALWRANQAQTRQLEQRLQELRDPDLTDVTVEAGVQSSGEGTA